MRERKAFSVSRRARSGANAPRYEHKQRDGLLASGSRKARDLPEGAVPHVLVRM